MTPIFNNNQLQFNLSMNEDVKLNGDEARIRQLLLILLDNAIKYTPSEGEVSLEVKSMHDKIEISVTDSGIGIAQKDIEQIFDRFYRVDKARSRDHGGTGLGLCIADWIVRSHNGSIKVNSEVDKGTSLFVEIPSNIENSLN